MVRTDIDIIFISLLFTLSNVKGNTSKSNVVVPCITPQNRVGQCVNLEKCDELVWMVQNKRNDEKALAYLRKAICGHKKTDRKVCCSSSTKKIMNAIAPETEQCGDGGDASIKHRIIQGDTVLAGDYPWMAALGYRQRYSNGHKIEWLCGGALISSKFVLTAAHCVVGVAPKELYTIRLGEIDFNDYMDDGASPIDVHIAKVEVHERYNSRPTTNDIALIRLKHPVQFNTNIKPICLPLQPEFKMMSHVNQNAEVAGWGRTISTSGPFSSSLQFISLPILSLDVCKKAYQFFTGSNVDSRNLCAGFMSGKKDSCQGDSGGPLMWFNGTDNRYYSIGIVSYGFKCAQEGYPGVYTRVSEYINWIIMKMAA